MKHSCVTAIAVTVWLLLPCGVVAERAPQTMGQDARVRDVLYAASDVIQVDTNLRVNTAIELGAGERINQVLLGDSESFEVEVLSNRNTISVKPVVSGAATNMTIYTGRRVISFFLTEGRTQTPTFRVVVTFPADVPVATARPAGGRDLGYQLSGDSEIRPIRVWNDGTSTFFEFSSDIRPSIFGLNAEGFEITQNSQTRGSVVRVEGIRPAYTIRIGAEYICIRRVAGGIATADTALAALLALEF